MSCLYWIFYLSVFLLSVVCYLLFAIYGSSFACSLMLDLKMPPPVLRQNCSILILINYAKSNNSPLPKPFSRHILRRYAVLFILCDQAHIILPFSSNSVKRKTRGRRREMWDPVSKIECLVDESEYKMEDWKRVWCRITESATRVKIWKVLSKAIPVAVCVIWRFAHTFEFSRTRHAIGIIRVVEIMKKVRVYDTGGVLSDHRVAGCRRITI